MGCDIHLYFEIKKEKKWEQLFISENLIPDERYYDLFYFLGDVKGNCPIQSEFVRRGIPDETSYQNHAELHSHTYATMYEILKAPWKKSGLDDCYFYIFFKYLLPRLISIYGVISEQDQKKIRVIMAFDN